MNISYNHGAGQGGCPDFFGCRITHVPIPAPPNQKRNFIFFIYSDRYQRVLSLLQRQDMDISHIHRAAQGTCAKIFNVGYHLDLCQPPLPKAEVKMFFYIHVDINEFYLSYKHRTWISLTSIELHKVHVHIFYGVRDHKYLDTHPPWSSHLPGDDRAW